MGAPQCSNQEDEQEEEGGGAGADTASKLTDLFPSQEHEVPNAS